MRQFKDNENRDWIIAINVAVLKRVKQLLDVDLLDVAGGGLIERLASDPVLLVDVLYAVCKPQAMGAGVSDEQFGEAMAGDVIESATVALLEELVLFFPSRRDRERAQSVLAAFWKAVDSSHDLLDAEAQKAIDKVQPTLEKTFGG